MLTEVNVLIKMNKFSRDPFNLVVKELTGCKEQIFHLLMIFTVETAYFTLDLQLLGRQNSSLKH